MTGATRVRRARGVEALAALGVAIVVVTGACTTPGDPVSPDPVRFELSGAPAPCRVVIGPLAPDPSFRFDEVGQIDTPDGPTYLASGQALDRGAPDVTVDGISVVTDAGDGVAEAWWQLPPSETGVRTRSLDEQELLAAVPELIGASSVAQLADLVAARIDGADVVVAGQAPAYDVATIAGDTTLSVAGRGVEPERLAALTGLLGWTHEANGFREPGGDGRAQQATVTFGSTASVTARAASLRGELERLAADAGPTVAVSDGPTVAVTPGCSPTPGTVSAPGAAVTDVAISESDVGDVLDLTVTGLPDAGPDGQLVHVTVGGVEIVGRRGRGDAVTVPAALAHDESRLLAELLG